MFAKNENISKMFEKVTFKEIEVEIKMEWKIIEFGNIADSVSFSCE